MKKILFAVVLAVCFNGRAFAVTDVNETAGRALVGYVSISSSAVTDISSNTMTNVFAYNICNEDSTNKVRCGYSTSVSTIAANEYQGFWVKPQECEYRAITYGIKIYCQAEGTAAIAITREVFGKYQ
jgi:hypothetical protein